MNEKQFLNRYLVKFRLSSEPKKEFWTDLMLFDVHNKSLKEILTKALEQAQSDSSSKLKRTISQEDISIISFSLIDQT